MANAITHFLPLRQAGVPRRGEGVDKLIRSPAHPLIRSPLTRSPFLPLQGD